GIRFGYSSNEIGFGWTNAVVLELLAGLRQEVGRRRQEVGGSVKDAQSYPIELESAKVQFLQEMAKQHGLPDIGKAIRCLVNYARENPEKHPAMFDEVRCLDC
ncbi:MAG: hypothetical protein ACRD09_10170, partial [Vicinamibacterales bacterium]